MHDTKIISHSVAPHFAALTLQEIENKRIDYQRELKAARAAFKRISKKNQENYGTSKIFLKKAERIIDKIRDLRAGLNALTTPVSSAGALRAERHAKRDNQNISKRAIEKKRRRKKKLQDSLLTGAREMLLGLPQDIGLPDGQRRTKSVKQNLLPIAVLNEVADLRSKEAAAAAWFENQQEERLADMHGLRDNRADDHEAFAAARPRAKHVSRLSAAFRARLSRQ